MSWRGLKASWGSCFLPSSRSQTAGVRLVPAATMALFYERRLHFARNPEQQITHNSVITGLKQWFLQGWVHGSQQDTAASRDTWGRLNLCEGTETRRLWMARCEAGSVTVKGRRAPCGVRNHMWEGFIVTAKVHGNPLYNFSSCVFSFFISLSQKPDREAPHVDGPQDSSRGLGRVHTVWLDTANGFGC